MARALPDDGAREALDGLFLARLTMPMESTLALYQPAFCFVAQGGKQVLVGEEVLWYDPGHYLLFTVDLPVIFRVEEASEAKPYFGLMLGEDLDAASAGHRVGYEDPAYFSRDYKKLFGAPPQRDIARLRGSLEPGGAPARV